MSLYYTQKVLYELNRNPEVQRRYQEDLNGLLDTYQLTDEERVALSKPDVGLLYVLGVNGQILMHFAAFVGQEWFEYIDAMRQGVAQHGPVRAGLYAMTTKENQA